ncbi:zinc-binding dehydrogenase [Kocuria koreensis]|jgi:(R,R)-butanediol dehydrogenase/meso-butanediol dehydrogenase/diacetyl reductase|uniref:Zinc-binding dehydrogenase n=1 Tax=Rothia koreensis TaxID=592378 RepID=A0A7K1LLD9_9MICC|nr:2,3-butanediol dehydrogenase [Rothia koreensis]MUN55853.1 zinc-binding dehydrogenase [Rothia koreensis]
MRAARYYQNHDIRIDDVEPPTAGPGEVLIDVAWSGICGTDLHEYLDGPIFVPPKGQPHPISGEEAPVTLGHEMSGTVAALGEGVDDLQVGQKVVVEPLLVRERDWEDPHYQLSPDMNFIGLGGGGGGLGEQIAVNRHWVHPIADSVGLDEAALIEPLSITHHAFMRSGATRGDTAIIGGAGPIGLLTAAVAKTEGLTVVVSELSDLRRQKALDAGVADYAFDPREVDVAEEVRGLTEGKGADVGFECSSVDVVLDMLLDAVRPAGVIVNVSIWGHEPKVALHKLVMKEIDLRGTIGYSYDHPATIKLVEEGRVDLRPFITGKIGLDDLIDKGFDTLINHNETAVKILVSPTGQGLES